MDRSKINKLQQTVNLLEELSWILEKSKKTVSFKDSSKLLHELIYENDLVQNHRNQIIHFSNSGKKNKDVLIGCLPKLLQNTELFGSNSELIDFAESVLNLKMSKSAKRSRNEYIGFIVCELANAKDDELSSFVHAIGEIAGNENKLNLVKDAKRQPNFTWNETIRIIGNL